MVESVTAWIRIVRASLLTSACLVAVTAVAQNMVDPTRPPSAQDDAASSAAPVLQSVLIGARRVEAIVSGKTVRVGDMVGDARVVKINEAEVILQNGKEVQALRLYPNIERRVAPSYAAAKADNRRQEK